MNLERKGDAAPELSTALFRDQGNGKKQARQINGKEERGLRDRKESQEVETL